MSGILGVWNLDGRPVDKDVLGKMAATLAHRGLDGCFFWADGPAGLACQQLKVTPESLNERQPLVGSSGAVVIFDGRLDNREEILAGLPQCKAARDAPDPELVLAAYEAYGEGFPENLNGDFAVAVFDPKARKLLLARDVVGVRPLYYYQTGQTFLFASEVKALLAHPQRPQKPNDDVLAWYVLRQPALDTCGLTFFDGVLTVRPGRIVTVTPEKTTIRQYWDFDRSQRIKLGSFEEYGEAFRPIFDRAVLRRLRSAYPVAIAVSGGLDSSGIFCAALRMNQQGVSGIPELVGISYVFEEDRSCDDKYFLSEIEREYGVSVERFTARVELPQSISAALRDIESPMVDGMTNTIRELRRRARARGARILATGLWGDQMLFDQSYLVTLFRRLRWREIGRHLQAFADWYPEVPVSYFRQRFYRDLVRLHIPAPLLPYVRKLRMRFAKPLPHTIFYTADFKKRSRWTSFDQPESDGFASSHAKSLYYTVRSGYYLHCLEVENKRWARDGLEMPLPFVDRDLVQFLMAIPGDMQSANGVPKAILRQALKGVLPETIGTRRGKADFTDYSDMAMNSARTPLLQLFEPTGVSIERGYVKPGVAEQVRGMNQPPGQDSLMTLGLSDLFGLEIWLREFFGNDASERKLPTWV